MRWARANTETTVVTYGVEPTIAQQMVLNEGAREKD